MRVHSNGNGVGNAALRAVSHPVDINSHAPNMTARMARAIGIDAGTRSMLRANRSSWNDEDLAAASAAYHDAMRYAKGAK